MNRSQIVRLWRQGKAMFETPEFAATGPDILRWFRENEKLLDCDAASDRIFARRVNFDYFVDVPDPGAAYRMPDRAFGVEIEGMVLGKNLSWRAAKERAKDALKKAGARNWRIKTDVSIYPPLRDVSDKTAVAMEIVSPKLRGEEGLAEYDAAATALHREGFRANDTCGLHLHVDMRKTLLCQKASLAQAFQENKETYHSYVTPERFGDLVSHNLYNTDCDAAFFDRLRQPLPRPLLGRLFPLFSPEQRATLNLIEEFCPSRNSALNLFSLLKHGSAEYRGKEGQAFPHATGYIRHLVRFTDTALDNPDARLPTLAELQAITPRRIPVLRRSRMAESMTP